jgi:hypothetical protein
MKNIGEKIKKAWRKMQRELSGESNRVSLIPEDYIPLKFIRPYADFYRHIASAPAMENRLEFAANRPLIEGEGNDVHQIRCLDHVIGKLTAAFNDAAPPSDKARAKIESHIADVADSLKRVRAYITIGDKMAPLKYLEYGKAGGTVVKIKLG